MKKSINFNHKVYKPTSRICTKSSRRLRRQLQKSEVRYRIVENTMRGYFNYSI